MFNIYKNSVVYVVCPAFTKTGGTELAHQLVKSLRLNNIDAYITYYGAQQAEPPLNPAFKEYVESFKTIEEITDDARNVVIVPEVCFYLPDRFHNIQKSIWWMSVDNYVKNDGFIGACKVNGFIKATKALVSGRIHLKKQGFDKNIIHLYQSEYANHFLNENGVSQKFPLSDYINDTFLGEYEQNNDTQRKNIVLYNPKKGYAFTQKIISKAPDINWMPLENMTTAQVRDALLSSKVYIDFGNHPGKDRFPREAAIMGCCVITGKRGSAAFYKDIPIAEKNKFGESSKDIESILCRIRICLEQYESEQKEYEKYRAMIASEHKKFDKDVKQLFRIVEEL